MTTGDNNRRGVSIFSFGKNAKRYYVPILSSALLTIFWSASASGQETTSQFPFAQIHRTSQDSKIAAYRQSLPELRPPIRGFRAPILEAASQPWPFLLPAAHAPGSIRQAAGIVSRRLAHDGLLPVTVEVINLIGAGEFSKNRQHSIETLKSVGLPVDWLAYFYPPAADGDTQRRDALDTIIARLASGEAPMNVRRDVASWTFEFSQSMPGFSVATDDGEEEIAAVRMQMANGNYWVGPGAGGTVDVARQLVEHLPDVPFFISIEDRFVDSLLQTAKTWHGMSAGQLTIFPEPLIVSQWAQDNGKSGTILDKKTSSRRIATLVPRYASRSEDGSIFIPGESFLIDSLAATGHTVGQSPLLFQGGNLLAIHDTRLKQRLLLIGEAEVYRNTSLGLTPQQTLEAFRVEFGVDRCLVVPAASFHIDFDLCVRAGTDRPTVFVNDPATASRTILELGIKAFRQHDILDAPTTENALRAIHDDKPQDFLKIIGPILGKQLDHEGHFKLSFANALSTGPTDSGVGNLNRFLVAMDWLVHAAIEPNDRHAAAYLRSFDRQEDDRTELTRLFLQLGYEVVEVPSTSDANRSINYINGLQVRGRYFMPAYGGLYAPLDQAAADIFHRTLGPSVEIIPIYCAETQCRAGALHCATSIYPKP